MDVLVKDGVLRCEHHMKDTSNGREILRMDIGHGVISVLLCDGCADLVAWDIRRAAATRPPKERQG